MGARPENVKTETPDRRLGVRTPSARRVLAAAATTVSFGALVIGLVGVACSNGPEPHFYAGGSLGSCEGRLAVEIKTSDCSGCKGPTAYALCNVDTFNVCVCDLPTDYFLDGGTVDTGSGPPLGGLVDFRDGAPPLPPCCQGKVVYELPATECPARCAGNSSYAVCIDDEWAKCACDIPEGYGFPDYICPGDF